jgi:hypothetical protein
VAESHLVEKEKKKQKHKKDTVEKEKEKKKMQKGYGLSDSNLDNWVGRKSKVFTV